MNESKFTGSLNAGKKPCSVFGCERPSRKKGMCNPHYCRQWKRPANLPPRPPCEVEGCEKPRIARGYCTLHYARWREHGDVTVTHRYDTRETEPRYCEFPECPNEHVANGLCRKHYMRMERHGDPGISSYLVGKGDTPELRFWSRVAITADPTRCWEWQGAVDETLYGYVRWCGKSVGVHRVAFELHNGYKPELHVLHSCDNPPCCNPRHLREGTDADNRADMIARGRTLTGEQNTFAKMDNESVLWARQKHKDGWSINRIANHLNMSRVAISRIINRKAWTHI